MQVVGVIPARYGSSRFPGKVLADIEGKPMVVRVYERAVQAECLDHLFIATDDLRIVTVCEKFNIPVCMTSSYHKSGTDRIWEAVSKMKAEIVVNIQGDEPLIETAMIEKVVARLSCVRQGVEAVSSLCCPLVDWAEYDNRNAVKVVLDDKHRAIYFSRAAIPYMDREQTVAVQGYKHVGLYAYTFQALAKFANLPYGRLEAMERLEQLRLLEAGVPFYMSVVENAPQAVDVFEDLDKVAAVYRKFFER